MGVTTKMGGEHLGGNSIDDHQPNALNLRVSEAGTEKVRVRLAKNS